MARSDYFVHLSIQCIAFCLICSSVYHTCEIPKLFAHDRGILSARTTGVPEVSLFAKPERSDFNTLVMVGLIRCVSAAWLLSFGKRCNRFVRTCIFAFHYYCAWSDVHALKSSEVHGVHGDFIMLEMIQIGFWCTSVSEEPSVLDFCMRFLFARVMWGCGICKLNEDWLRCRGRRCTVGHAFPSHWTSQEMPSLLAFYMRRLPAQKLFTLMTLFVECFAAIFIWGSQRQRAITCVISAMLMGGIITTGSFGVFPLTILMISIALLVSNDDGISASSSSTSSLKKDELQRRGIVDVVLSSLSHLYAVLCIVLSFQIYVLDRYELIKPSGDAVDALTKLKHLNADTLLAVGEYGVFSQISRHHHRSIAFETSTDGNVWDIAPWRFLPSDDATLPVFLGPWTFGYVERKLFNNMKHEKDVLPPYAVCLMRALLRDELRNGHRYGLPTPHTNVSRSSWIRLTRARWEYASFDEYSATGRTWNTVDGPSLPRYVVAGPVNLAQLDDVLRTNGVKCSTRDSPNVYVFEGTAIESLDHDSLFVATMSIVLTLLFARYFFAHTDGSA